MFDIGFAELLLIGLIALIVIGPKRLPETARFVGYWVGKLRRSVGKARYEMEREFGIDEIKREVHNTLLLEQLDKERRQVETQLNEATEHVAKQTGESNTPDASSWLREGEDIEDEEVDEPDLTSPAAEQTRIKPHSPASEQNGQSDSLTEKDSR